MNQFPRETVEFQAVAVTLDGAPVTTGVTFAVVHGNARPTTFIAPTVLGDEIGVMITGLSPGAYRVWAKVVAAPETVVINCGSFQID